MHDSLSIAICGCGPAGLAAALLLHRAGYQVQIFDQFSVPRPVGSGLILQPTGLGVLAELGVSEQLIKLGATIERLYGRVLPSNRVVLDVRYRCIGAGWCALAVHRAALFEVLHSAACAEGIKISSESTISHVKREAEKAIPVTIDGQHLGRFDGTYLIIVRTRVVALTDGRVGVAPLVDVIRRPRCATTSTAVRAATH